MTGERLPVLCPDGVTRFATVTKIAESFSIDGAGAIRDRRVLVDGRTGLATGDGSGGRWIFKPDACGSSQ